METAVFQNPLPLEDLNHQTLPLELVNTAEDARKY